MKYINSRRAANAVFHKAEPLETNGDFVEWWGPACGARLDLANASVSEAEKPEPWWPLCPKTKCFGPNKKGE
ncbi:hypothetical protein [Streptomyces sp. NPDC018055]|uniref:hypothetical protein n=1 Tax=Streptomyces sp. NPDC018055 TaxID=3365038 RepID=UPI0037AF4CCA